MVPRPRSLSLLLLAVATAACATTRFQGGVDGYRGAAVGAPAPSLHTIAVAANTSEANSLFAMEVKSKIESLLRTQGYRVSSVDSADFVLLNAFGIGSPQSVATGGVVLPLRNMIVYAPTSTTTYFRWLLLGLAPTSSLRAAATTGAAIQWSWVGSVTSAGTSGDLRLVLDYLLVAGFDQFPKSTGRRVDFDIGENDVRVKRLRGR